MSGTEALARALVASARDQPYAAFGGLAMAERILADPGPLLVALAEAGVLREERLPFDERRYVSPGIAVHDCETCTDCLHDGARCCGCYDGMCCQEATPQPTGRPPMPDTHPLLLHADALRKRAHRLRARTDYQRGVAQGLRMAANAAVAMAEGLGR